MLCLLSDNLCNWPENGVFLFICTRYSTQWCKLCQELTTLQNKLYLLIMFRESVNWDIQVILIITSVLVVCIYSIKGIRDKGTHSLWLSRHLVLQTAASVADLIVYVFDFSSILKDGMRLCKCDDAYPDKKKTELCFHSGGTFRGKYRGVFLTLMTLWTFRK